MKLLKEISERSLGITDKEPLGKTYRVRKSARAVLIDSDGNVSIQLVGKHNYYKLPGGGVDEGETVEEALRREIIEEVGCELSIEAELGLTIEYRKDSRTDDDIDELHLSYGYLCRVEGDISEPQYEQGEIDDGFEPVWMSLDEAIEKMETSNPTEPYLAKFIIEREKVFLQEVRQLLHNNPL